jgi:leucyl aminopeptidase (aminopeptidase T)
MGTVKEGASNLINNCLALKPSERALIVTDKDNYEICMEIFKASEKISEGNELIVLEDYTERPSTKLPQGILEKIHFFNVTIWAAKNMVGELPMRKEFRETAVKYARHAHMVGLDERIMSQGMCANYEKISKVTWKTFEVLKKASKIEVANPMGTRLSIDIGPRLKWIACHGLYHKKGEWGNEPEGEVYTCPARVEGTIMAEEFGDWLCGKYGALKTPVRIEIKNSRAVIDSIKADNQELKTELESYLKTDENSTRVGEFSIPTNIDVMKLPLIGNLLQDEKARVHLAFGDSYSDETGSGWSSSTHLDCLIPNATVILQPGNVKIMENGKLL